jgi:hypothetical protein
MWSQKGTSQGLQKLDHYWFWTAALFQFTQLRWLAALYFSFFPLPLLKTHTGCALLFQVEINFIQFTLQACLCETTKD